MEISRGIKIQEKKWDFNQESTILTYENEVSHNTHYCGSVQS